MLGSGFPCRVHHAGSGGVPAGTCVAFNHFGGVPGRIRYDNLKPAVVKVMGRNRTESDRFRICAATTAATRFFCRPGKDGAHEKGRGGGEIGRFRRRHLVPVPEVASLAELNRFIAAGICSMTPGDHRPSAHDRRGVRRRSAAVAESSGRGVRSRSGGAGGWICGRGSVCVSATTSAGPLRRAALDRTAQRHHRGSSRRTENCCGP